jgi:Tfp pilus assembly protein PilO
MNSSTRKIASIAAVVAVVLVGLWYFALLKPQSHHLATDHKAHAAAEQEIGQLDSTVTQLQALVRQIPADSARLKTLEADLPNNPSLDSALDQLHQVAVATGVAITTLSPSTPATPAVSGSASPATPGGPAISLSISTTGSYSQVMSFLTALARMPRTLVVDHVTLGAGSQVGASINARIFYVGSPTP